LAKNEGTAIAEKNTS